MVWRTTRPTWTSSPSTLAFTGIALPPKMPVLKPFSSFDMLRASLMVVPVGITSMTTPTAYARERFLAGSGLSIVRPRVMVARPGIGMVWPGEGIGMVCGSPTAGAKVMPAILVSALAW